MAYCFLDSEKLKTGDVILETSNGKISALIRAGDRIEEVDARVPARFSHAFIYVGMGYIMEADEGVRSVLAARVITETPDRFLIVRHPAHKNGINVQWLEEFSNMGVFAVLHPEVNKDYNWRGVFGTKLPFVGSTEGTYFCSQLVGECYRRLSIELFEDGRSPELITPNSLLSKQCKLEPVSTEKCFSKLPEADWVAEIARLNRYRIIENEPIPLAKISHDVSKRMVREFSPRINAATNKIGKAQIVESPQDMMMTLYFPDLPDGDGISDDMVSFMKTNYPTDQIRKYRAMNIAASENFLGTRDPRLIRMMEDTINRDLNSVPGMISMVETQIEMMRSVPSPPFKKRSFHWWQLGTLETTLAEEREFLEWRRTFLKRIG